jgi:hypothetical protein
MPINTFFLVWSPTGSRVPSYRHNTHDGALAEAMRLAREARGAEFFVLAATDHVKFNDVSVTRLLGSEDDIPF